jgi:hypothetical protein
MGAVQKKANILAKDFSVVKKLIFVFRRIVAIALPPRLCRWFLLRSLAFARRNFDDALLMVEQFEIASKKVVDNVERAVHDGHLRELRAKIIEQRETFDDMVRRISGAIEQAALIAKDRSFAGQKLKSDPVGVDANRQI